MRAHGDLNYPFGRRFGIRELILLRLHCTFLFSLYILVCILAICRCKMKGDFMIPSLTSRGILAEFSIHITARISVRVRSALFSQDIYW